MGGGAILSRGTACVAAVARLNHPLSASAICNICTAQTRVGLASSTNCEGHQNPPLPVHVPSQLAGRDVDDWEFLEEQDSGQRLVFGSPPTAEEVDEASLDLQNAIRLGLVPASSSRSTSLGKEDGIRVSDLEFSISDDGQMSEASQEVATPWVEPPTVYSNRRRVRAGGGSAVSEALQLFQQNPGVQGIVRSLATDKAVWDAVWRNEEVQEFRRRLQESRGAPGDANSAEHAEPAPSGNPNLYARVVERTKKAISQLMEGVIDFISGAFELADSKVFAEKDGDPFDRTIKSCMVLAVMVLTIVSVKRSWV